MIELPFTHRPGRRERHLRRRHGNPLFAQLAESAESVEPEALLAAQKADHEEMQAFRDALHQLLQRAVDLPPDAGSDQVLTLKADLERHFEQACGLPEDQGPALQAIERLIEVIMQTVRRHAGADPLAQQELDEEAAARAIHFRLLRQPLIADLLHPESPIRPEELAPALLSATPAEVQAACEIFDADQLASVLEQGAALCQQLRGSGLLPDTAEQALTALRTALNR
ncbi:hypothetical protein F2Q65_17035 [Thiohalocapsa marina]|uniref:Uncharacterized protein n=1 Tax=Thiohalocapsa marina TaxID=424902 RepID=A0A5M8FKF0_9GAMM|nr:hypothetical protein [Thiohalocapsa marina]KAA6182915.1 hypothetical protein F2Q65_17035 [Thiohalocapsa marina]